MLRIAIVKGVLANYSKGFYDRLFARNDSYIHVYCQEKIPGINIDVIHDLYPANITLVKFWAIDGEKITWQFIPWKTIIKNFDVIFIEGNPRNLSHAFFATYLRLRRHKVILWTMAHSYRSNLRLERIRLTWSRIFKYLLVYNDDEVDFLRKKGFKKNIIVGMNNGLDQREIDSIVNQWTISRLSNWQQENCLEKRTLILSCARLVSKNKFNEVVSALPLIIKRYPNILWCIIGDGPEKIKLQDLVISNNLENHVRFVGGLYDEHQLAPWFLSSQLFIHPVAVGLSLLHAFGYGLPVIISNDKKKHGPEFAAFQEKLSGYTYEEGDIEELSQSIIKLLDNPLERAKMKSYNQKVAREKFNNDVMVERFIDIAKQCVLNLGDK